MILGHLAIFLLAIPYYPSLGYISLIKILLLISLFILFYSLPFFIDGRWMSNTSLRTFLPIIYGLALFLLISYGVFTVTKSYILSILYPLLVLAVSNLFVLHRLLEDLKNPPPPLKILRYMDDIIFIVGILSFLALTAKYGTIPILDYKIRMAISKDPLRLISTGALVYGGMCNIFYFLVAFILLLLLGYKAGILILFTSFLL
ncbi:oligosaccharide repeat unit polymerase, partial [Methanothermococcus sp. SCGC AD-155-E23]|nr:oligosaccharide repeat unit polymerase [Methanothermococcus sp. SCGC AD-155-E23]